MRGDRRRHRIEPGTDLDARQDQPAFRAFVEQHGGTARLVLTGEIDLASAPALEHHLDDIMRAASAVELDLSGISFVDSTALHVFLLARQRAVDNGCGLRITNQSTVVRRLLQATGLTEILDSAPPLAEGDTAQPEP